MENNSNLKDFYFSQKLKNVLTSDKTVKVQHTPSYINGKEFTEMVDYGKKPATNVYLDNVLVGTGFVEEVQYNKVK